MNLAFVFVTICLVFVLTHVLRIILAIEAVVRASQMTACVSANLSYIPPLPLVCMESVSHIMIMSNSSCNFLIYCTISTHFKVFMKKLFWRRTRGTRYSKRSFLFIHPFIHGSLIM